MGGCCTALILMFIWRLDLMLKEVAGVEVNSIAHIAALEEGLQTEFFNISHEISSLKEDTVLMSEWVSSVQRGLLQQSENVTALGSRVQSSLSASKLRLAKLEGRYTSLLPKLKKVQSLEASTLQELGSAEKLEMALTSAGKQHAAEVSDLKAELNHHRVLLNRHGKTSAKLESDLGHLKKRFLSLATDLAGRKNHSRDLEQNVSSLLVERVKVQGRQLTLLRQELLRERRRSLAREEAIFGGLMTRLQGQQQNILATDSSSRARDTALQTQLAGLSTVQADPGHFAAFSRHSASQPGTTTPPSLWASLPVGFH